MMGAESFLEKWNIVKKILLYIVFETIIVYFSKYSGWEEKKGTNKKV